MKGASAGAPFLSYDPLFTVLQYEQVFDIFASFGMSLGQLLL